MAMLRRLQTSSRFLLTGTPVQNNMSEMWSLMNFLLPEIFDEPVRGHRCPSSIVVLHSFQEVFERYFEIDTVGNANMIFQEEQERSVLSIFHQVIVNSTTSAAVDLIIRVDSHSIYSTPPKIGCRSLSAAEERSDRLHKDDSTPSAMVQQARG